jgi:hypothetical protein
MPVIRPNYFVLASLFIFGLFAKPLPGSACMTVDSVVQLGSLKTPLNFLTEDADVAFFGGVQQVNRDHRTAVFKVEKAIKGVKDGDLFTAALLPNAFLCGQLSQGEVWLVFNIPEKSPTPVPKMSPDYMKDAIEFNSDGSNVRPVSAEEKEKAWKREWNSKFQHIESGWYLRDRYGHYDEGTNKIIKEKFGYDISTSSVPVIQKEISKKP